MTVTAKDLGQRGQAHFSAVRRVPRTTQDGPKNEPVPSLPRPKGTGTFFGRQAYAENNARWAEK